MNIINLNGGLGNQLFQYSFGLAMKYEFDIDIKFCDKLINPNQIKIQDIFDVNIPLVNKNDYNKTIGKFFSNDQLRYYFLRLLRKIGINKFKNFVIENYKEPHIYLPSDDSKFFYGYWQNYNFFFKHIDLIQKNLKIKDFSKITKLLDNLYNKYSHIVCLHFRFGDYKHKKNIKVYSEIPLNYYQESIALFEKKLSKPVFILFSDQLEKIDKSYLKNNVIPSSSILKNSNDDFKAMTYCDCFILANSTFSLWGAYLSQKKNKYVAKPPSWFRDKKIEKANQYYPDNWRYLL